MAELADELQQKVKAAAQVACGVRRAGAGRRVRRGGSAVGARPDKIVFVGASTGGVEALKALLMGLPPDCPPTLVTQHMPARFTTGFAERLNRECPMRVSEAAHDQRRRARPCLYRARVAPSRNRPRTARHLVCRLSDGPPVSGHRPSVDVLFRSAARVAPRRRSASF